MTGLLAAGATLDDLAAEPTARERLDEALTTPPESRAAMDDLIAELGRR